MPLSRVVNVAFPPHVVFIFPVSLHRVLVEIGQMFRNPQQVKDAFVNLGDTAKEAEERFNALFDTMTKALPAAAPGPILLAREFLEAAVPLGGVLVEYQYGSGWVIGADAERFLGDLGFSQPKVTAQEFLDGYNDYYVEGTAYNIVNALVVP